MSENATLLPIDQLKQIWDKALLDKKITKTLYDANRFVGFMLEDGTKVTYDSISGIEILVDPATGEVIQYN